MVPQGLFHGAKLSSVSPGGALVLGAEHVVDGGAEPVELVGDGEVPPL
jgi:hypothetical protein